MQNDQDTKIINSKKWLISEAGKWSIKPLCYEGGPEMSNSLADHSEGRHQIRLRVLPAHSAESS